MLQYNELEDSQHPQATYFKNFFEIYAEKRRELLSDREEIEKQEKKDHLKGLVYTLHFNKEKPFF